MPTWLLFIIGYLSVGLGLTIWVSDYAEGNVPEAVPNLVVRVIFITLWPLLMTSAVILGMVHGREPPP